MKMRIQLAAALGAATALLLPASQAGAAIGNPEANFVGTTSLGDLDVKCTPGASTGTLTERLRLAARGTPLTVAQGAGVIGNSTKIVASWPGGSATMTRFGRQYLLSSGAKFPCPAIDGTPMTINFQPYRGSRKVGVASSAEAAEVRLNWSGPRVIRPFAGLTSVENIRLSQCVPSTRRNPAYAPLTQAFNVSASHTTAGIPQGLLGDDLNRRVTKIVASWPQGSATIKRYDTNVAVTAGTKFPCVNPADPNSRDLTIAYQAYAGSAKVGQAARNIVRLAQAGDPGVVLAGATVPAGGSVSTPNNSTAVTSPSGGPVAISESAPTGQPNDSNYAYIGKEITIDAPPATVANPLILTFKFNTAVSLDDFGISRNGVVIPNCAVAGTSGPANPDPCLGSKTKNGNEITAVVRTSHASTWNGAKKTSSPSQ